MNPVAEEIMSYFGCSLDDEESLEHIGMPRRSGRYAWGSGENPGILCPTRGENRVFRCG